MRAALPLLAAAALVLSGCSPGAVGTEVTKRAARTVVMPVVGMVAPPPADALATDCIIANASNAELNVLARDVGVRAGTTTELNVRMIAERPATRACIAGKGLAPLVFAP